MAVQQLRLGSDSPLDWRLVGAPKYWSWFFWVKAAAAATMKFCLGCSCQNLPESARGTIGETQAPQVPHPRSFQSWRCRCHHRLLEVPPTPTPTQDSPMWQPYPNPSAKSKDFKDSGSRGWSGGKRGSCMLKAWNNGSDISWWLQYRYCFCLRNDLDRIICQKVALTQCRFCSDKEGQFESIWLIRSRFVWIIWITILWLYGWIAKTALPAETKLHRSRCTTAPPTSLSIVEEVQ